MSPLSALLLGAVGSARAADQWFVMGEQTLNATDPSAEIKTEGSRWKKDVKQVRLAVEGAERPDDKGCPWLGTIAPTIRSLWEP